MMTKKEIWIATIGEPLPGDGEQTRLLRSCQFAIWLSEKGHKVTFITNSVDHYARRQRSNETTEINYSDNLKIVLLWTRLYNKSVSFDRFMSHRDISSSFKSWQCNVERKPNVIVSAYPSFEICRELSGYAKQQQIPIFIDCRDAWPDIFFELAPRPLRLAVKGYQLIQNQRVRKLFNTATGLLAHSSEFLDWALSKAARTKTGSDAVFHFTYPSVGLGTPSAQNKPKNSINVIFAGTLTHRNDLEACLPAFKKGNHRAIELKLTVAGSGEDAERLKKICRKHNYNVDFLGWQDAEKLKYHLSQADFGLLPYLRDDFKLGIPNKFPEYIANKLPVICISKSACGSMVRDFDCGITLDSERHLIHSELHEKLAKTNSKLIEKMSQNASNLFASQFQRDQVFGTIEKHILSFTN